MPGSEEPALPQSCVGCLVLAGLKGSKIMSFIRKATRFYPDFAKGAHHWRALAFPTIPAPSNPNAITKWHRTILQEHARPHLSVRLLPRFVSKVAGDFEWLIWDALKAYVLLKWVLKCFLKSGPCMVPQIACIKDRGIQNKLVTSKKFGLVR